MEDNIQIVKQVYNMVAEKYDSSLSDDETNCLSRFFSIVEGDNLIDLGCGQGKIAEYCHEQKGFNITGYDISEKMLIIADKKNKYKENIHFVLSDMQTAESTIVFDAAIASFSLIHLTNDQVKNTLFNLRKMLKPGGYLYISVLAGTLCDYISEPLDSRIKIFVHQYTESTITALLESVNYKVVEINYGEDNAIAALSKNAIFIFARREK